MHKLSDCVDYADSRLNDLILEALGEGLWIIFRHSEIDPAAPCRGVAHTVVTDEILNVLGLCPLRSATEGSAPTACARYYAAFLGTSPTPLLPISRAVQGRQSPRVYSLR